MLIALIHGLDDFEKSFHTMRVMVLAIPQAINYWLITMFFLEMLQKCNLAFM